LISRSRALRAIDENRDLIVGIKVRVRGTADSLENDLKLMAQLREIADETGLPTMMHWTNETRLVDMLRPGDCMTHPFNPAYLGPNCIDEQGRVRSLTRELAERGIMVDLGHGSSFDWHLAEAAASQGWYPDVLSTDMFSRYFRPDGVVGDMGSLLSKFLLLGLNIGQVVRRATVAPVTMLGLPGDLGRLAVGGVADLTVLETRQGRFEFVDSPRLKQVRTGSVKLVARAVVKDGALFELAG
jgi:dihydroorotase